MTRIIAQAPQTLTRKLTYILVAAVGVLALGAAISPDRVWANMLIATFYLVTLGLGGALFVALTTVCGAGWSVAFRRVPEAMTGLLISGVALLVILAVRLPDYAWHHHGDGEAGTFWFKELWLSPMFLAGRAVGYLALWIVFARMLVAESQRQDRARGTNEKSFSRKSSAVFLAVFAVTISLAGIDWIMALEPLWFSTMWGVYQFSGLIMGTLAAIIIACITLRRFGPLHGVFRDDHLHDLGKLLIGFSCFWMYIWFSQYMLIWYSNIPEETSYFIRRTHGAWGPVVIGSLALNWVIPFFVLLPNTCKRSESIMLKVAVVVLIGRWVDLYVMVFPALSASGTTGATDTATSALAFGQPVFGVIEFAAMTVVVCAATLQFVRSFFRHAAVPRNDPFLSESLHYHA